MDTDMTKVRPSATEPALIGIPGSVVLAKGDQSRLARPRKALCQHDHPGRHRIGMACRKNRIVLEKNPWTLINEKAYCTHGAVGFSNVKDFSKTMSWWRRWNPYYRLKPAPVLAFAQYAVRDYPVSYSQIFQLSRPCLMCWSTHPTSSGLCRPARVCQKR
jgi:hypothetical protein